MIISATLNVLASQQFWKWIGSIDSKLRGFYPVDPLQNIHLVTNDKSAKTK